MKGDTPCVEDGQEAISARWRDMREEIQKLHRTIKTARETQALAERRERDMALSLRVARREIARLQSMGRATLGS